MGDSANVSLVRAGNIHYTVIRGDAFAPPPVAFRIKAAGEDTFTNEDFTGATIKMQVRADNKRVLAEITDGSGITVNANALQYVISGSDIETWAVGIYRYDVQKTVSGISATIQKGTITVIDEVTQ